MLSKSERNLIESWRTELRREKQVQPALSFPEARQAATSLRRWLSERRTRPTGATS